MASANGTDYGSPLFICGFPKSGTTLLLALLDHHPELLVFPEETMFRKWATEPRLWSLDYLLSETPIQAFQHGEVNWTSGYRNYEALDYPRFKSLTEARQQAAEPSARTMLEAVIFSYGDVTGQTDRKHWVEKTPSNEHSLNEIVRWWPDARALYIVRDPRDNYASYYSQKHGDYNPIRFVKDWSASIAKWERFAASRPDHSLRIRYEDLVREPEATLKHICRFLDIQWDDNLLIPTRNGVFWSGNSRDMVEFEGISDKPVGKFRQKLSGAEIEFLEVWLKDALNAFDYRDTDTPGRLTRTSGAFLKEKPRTGVRMVRSVRKMRNALRESKETSRE
ncbi:MAG: sulfotransferase [Anaerolineae bacterium]|nr:sulfotransferase [Anaerolineae bacterium]